MGAGCVKTLGSLLLASLVAAAGCGGRHADSPTPLSRWHNNQGVAFMDQHNYTRAEEEFGLALAGSPRYALAHANLGIARFSLGRYDSAAVALEQALRLDPALLQAHYTMGLIASAQGRDYGRALQYLERVVAAAPDDPHALYYRGQAKAKLGRAEEAIGDFGRAIQLDPYNVSAHYALANQYRQLGRKEEWRTALARFNELTRAGHQGVSSSYQGQGVYAEALADIAPTPPDSGDAGVPPRFAPPVAVLPSALAGAPALAADLDGDQSAEICLLGDSLYVLPAEARRPIAVAPVGPGADRLAAADWDEDGDVDLLVGGASGIRLLTQQDGRWSAAEPLVPQAQGLGVADADHDGDVDVIAVLPGGLTILANDGQGHLVPGGTVLAPAAGRNLDAVRGVDLDNDRDTDLVMLLAGRLEIFANNRDGTFSPVTAALGVADAGTWADLAVEDVDRDGFVDLLLLGGDGRLQEMRNQRGRALAPQPPVQLPAGAYDSLLMVDLDLDGDLDAVAAGPAGLRIAWRRHGRLEPLPEAALPDGIAGGVVASDWDGDGTPDLLAGGRLLPNRTPAGHWLRVAVQGLGSNGSGLGAKVEVKTTWSLQKREVAQAAPLLFGIGAADSVEFVRVLWPSGVRQTELAMPADTTLLVSEVDRKGTSCPVVYAWDGQRYRFVSDVNGGAIVGYLLGPGQYNVPDTDEYLPLGPLAPRDGFYEIQFGNHLEEVLFADALRLVAVDHPPTVEVLPNERLLAAPPYPPFALYALADLRPPERVVDDQGRDVTDRLRAVDDVWYDGFRLTDIHGYAEGFWLELDLVEAGPAPVLVAHGWVDYAHSTSNWAAAQRGWALTPVRLEVPDGRGGWRTACADIGTPAGLPKKMVFDLAGVLPAGTRRIRLATNTAVYWDQFLIGQRRDVPLAVQTLDPASADLHWRGYPEHTAINNTFAFRYDYDRLRLEAPWSSHAGRFTRYGPVEELLDRADDRYVILSHGDELTLRFDAAALAPPAAGNVRSFMLYSDGFGKDMDFHSAGSLTVDPLPFHGMTGYPYGPEEAYPATAAVQEYMETYNTRARQGYY